MPMFKVVRTHRIEAKDRNDAIRKTMGGQHFNWKGFSINVIKLPTPKRRIKG